MQSDEAVKEPIKRKSFLSRQLSDEGTTAQTVFDFVFGILAPILALAFDPILFRVDESCGGLRPFLGEFTLFAYFAIALGIATLAVWLVAGRWLRSATAFFAGVLFAGAFFAGALGIRLLPLSVIGLMAVIGVLGFTPFVTAFVYFRNGRRAAVRTVDAAPSTSKAIMKLAIMGLAALLVLGLPAVAQWRAMNVISEATETLVSDPTEDEHDQAIEQLRQFSALCLGLCRSMVYVEFSKTWAKDYDVYYPILREDYAAVTGVELMDCSDV